MGALNEQAILYPLYQKLGYGPAENQAFSACEVFWYPQKKWSYINAMYQGEI